MKTLYKSKSDLVCFNKSLKSPDIVAQTLLKSLANTKNSKIKNVILIYHVLVKHEKILHSEEIIVLCLIQRKQIKKICIQKNDFELNILGKFKNFRTFAEYKKEFTTNHQNKLVFTPNNLFQLFPISIPKPWGQEIWYSGIEARGISNIGVLSSNSTEKSSLSNKQQKTVVPLSWFMASVQNMIFGKKFSKKDPILIKMLDPLPKEVTGDLYYELHLKKNEVYVVTQIHDNIGKIKIGINQEKLNAYNGDKDQYKNDFLKSILEYEKIRKKIDELIDKNQKISLDLNKKEVILRNIMDSFCGYVDLNVGDVIDVPIHTPHSLQHGVKVIEFQTPTYERLIISFAQKVLTQKHWDTRQAFDVINLNSFQPQTLKILSKTKNLLKELVCSFKDFEVQRWTLNKNSKYKLEKEPYYRILFMINGEINAKIENISNKIQATCAKILPDMCVLIPQNVSVLLNSRSKKCVFLICRGF